MQETITKQEISKTFYKRYIEQNATNRLSVDMLKFMWFKEGKFIHPMKKDETLQKYIQEEIEDFNCGRLNLPQVEFCITTKCSLKCVDCCALIPQLNKVKHIDMTFEDFKNQLDSLLMALNSLRTLIILGGEPLINPNLAKMLDYALRQEKISITRLTTNATIIPNDELIEVLNKYNKKIYVFLSNYSANSELSKLSKYEEIKEILHKNNIKFQMVDSWNWLEEKGMSKTAQDDIDTVNKAQNCYRIKCSQILNSKFDICSKALVARELGIIDTNDYIDILNSKNLKEDLIKFFNKPFSDSCKYCILSDKTVKPALQEK